MKKWLLFLFSIAIFTVVHASPRNPYPTTPTQVWQNDQDLDSEISQKLSTVTFPSVNCASVTCAGSIYNSAGQLVQLDANAGVALASATISILNVPNTKSFVSNNQIFPIVKIAQFTTTTSSSVTSGSFTDTHLSGTITPKFSTSKFVILVSGDFAQVTGTSVGYATLSRNGSNLAGSGGYTLTVAGNNYSAGMTVYDSPATSSDVTYTVQIRTNGGGTAIFPITDGGTFTSTATMLVIEIAQ